MYGNNVGNAQFAAQNPPFEPRLPGPLSRPLVKVNLSKQLIRTNTNTNTNINTNTI